jgi:hypothetical protein
MDILIGAISLVATIIGLYLITEKKSSGFIYYTVSVSAQAILFIFQHNWLLVINMIILIISNVFAFIKWKREEVK